jgi:hypothetical protein
MANCMCVINFIHEHNFSIIQKINSHCISFVKQWSNIFSDQFHPWIIFHPCGTFLWDIVLLIIGQILNFNNLFISSNHPLFKKLFSFLKEANSYAYSRDKLPHTHTHFSKPSSLASKWGLLFPYFLPLLEQHMFHIYVLSWTYLVHLGIRLNPKVYPFNWTFPLGIRLNPNVYPFDWILPFGIGLNPRTTQLTQSFLQEEP